MSDDVGFRVDPSSLASILNNEGIEPFKRPKGSNLASVRKIDLKASRILPKFGQSEKKRKATPIGGGGEPRTSFSERKAPSNFKPKLFHKTRRELNFSKPDAKIMPPPASAPTSAPAPAGLAAKLMLLGRESISGLPRDSLSGLFRQSLTMNELNHLFGDDSTCSFEDLEKRLRTPGKKRVIAPPQAAHPSPRKCISTLDLRQNHHTQNLSKSNSMTHLPSNTPLWLKEAQDTLLEIRDENALLSEQLSEMDKKIKERRSAFKEAWGVSPKSINKVRTQKSDILKQIFGKKDEEHSSSTESQSEDKSSPPTSPQSKINVNIPICLNEQSGNMSIVHDNNMNGSHLNFKSPKRFDISAPTPMALRHLSQKVKMELSSLYDG